MTKMSEIAVTECVGELRAACRRPIDRTALDTVIEWMRPNFEKALDRPDGGKRWAHHGPRLRENSRHLGALADFFGTHAGVDLIGIDELTHAVTMVRADCTTKAQRGPLAYEYCNAAPVNAAPAETFLRALAPAAELMSRAG
jgi:hypothetical protein